MNYELAKELKKAGFKLRSVDLMSFDEEEREGKCTYCGQRGFQDEECYNLYPTLSELIEACGKELLDMSQMFDSETNKSLGWVVNRYKIDSVIYDTLEEAVARLWLELNKK